jgi:hypothetical protein
MSERIEITPASDGKMAVAEEFVCPITLIPGIYHAVTIPEGYIFDGASIPRLVWSFIGHPFDPKFIEAAVVHDWYCDRAAELRDYQLRVIGDVVFFALLRRAGVSWRKRSSMYLAVRSYGLWSFRKVRK